MADIKIINLSGSNLFDDAESFMSEINDDSVNVIGGAIFTCRNTKINCEANTCGYVTAICRIDTAIGCGFVSIRPK
jgi:hypothetical protein